MRHRFIFNHLGELLAKEAIKYGVPVSFAQSWHEQWQQLDQSICFGKARDDHKNALELLRLLNQLDNLGYLAEVQ